MFLYASLYLICTVDIVIASMPVSAVAETLEYVQMGPIDICYLARSNLNVTNSSYNIISIGNIEMV